MTENARENVEQTGKTKNVVLFGESGVGKSSLINLIAEHEVSKISSGALGCTLEYQQHVLNIGDRTFAIWDTAGLNEGSHGSVPAEKAEAFLRQLLRDLIKNDGIDLLIYCVRGTRVRTALLTNYHIFYSAICRRKVPIVIVITGLENQEKNMETWWYENEREFTSLRMFFDGHACVTTLQPLVENAIISERREISRAAVIKAIISTSRTQRWKPSERSWIDSAYPDIRAMLSPRTAPNTHLSNIIMCEAYRNDHSTRRRCISSKNPATRARHHNLLNFHIPATVLNDASRSKLPFEQGIKSTPQGLYRVYQVPSDIMEEETKVVAIVRRAADLLIFCVKIEEKVTTVRSQWEYFNLTYGGDLSPRITVVIGASDQSSAIKWWKDEIGCAVVRHDVEVAYWPGSTTDADIIAPQRNLQRLINECCLDCSKVTFMRNSEELFPRRPRLERLNLTALWTKSENNYKDDGSPPGQDILTKLGVWNGYPERSPHEG